MLFRAVYTQLYCGPGEMQFCSFTQLKLNVEPKINILYNFSFCPLRFIPFLLIGIFTKCLPSQCVHINQRLIPLIFLRQLHKCFHIRQLLLSTFPQEFKSKGWIPRRHYFVSQRLCILQCRSPANLHKMMFNQKFHKNIPNLLCGY